MHFFLRQLDSLQLCCFYAKSQSLKAFCTRVRYCKVYSVLKMFVTHRWFRWSNHFLNIAQAFKSWFHLLSKKSVQTCLALNVIVTLLDGLAELLWQLIQGVKKKRNPEHDTGQKCRPWNSSKGKSTAHQKEHQGSKCQNTSLGQIFCGLMKDKR